MQTQAEPLPGEALEVAADQAIAACGGDARDAVMRLIWQMSSWRRGWPSFKLRYQPAIRAANSSARRLTERIGTTDVPGNLLRRLALRERGRWPCARRACRMLQSDRSRGARRSVVSKGRTCRRRRVFQIGRSCDRRFRRRSRAEEIRDRSGRFQRLVAETGTGERGLISQQRPTPKPRTRR